MVKSTESILFKLFYHTLFYISIIFGIIFHILLKYEDFHDISIYKQYNNITKKLEIVNKSYVDFSKPNNICVITGNQVFR